MGESKNPLVIKINNTGIEVSGKLRKRGVVFAISRDGDNTFTDVAIVGIDTDKLPDNRHDALALALWIIHDELHAGRVDHGMIANAIMDLYDEVNPATPAVLQ